VLVILLTVGIAVSDHLYTMQSLPEQKINAEKTKELFEFVKWAWRKKSPQERVAGLKKLLTQPGIDVNGLYRGQPILYIIATELGSHNIPALRDDITIYQLLLEAGAIPFATNQDAPRQTAREVLMEEIDRINRLLKLPFYHENPDDAQTIKEQKQLKQLQEIVELLKKYEKKAIPPAPPAPDPTVIASSGAQASSSASSSTTK
jgi:uncharacterized protein YihD (DUF1040 family)